MEGLLSTGLIPSSLYQNMVVLSLSQCFNYICNLSYTFVCLCFSFSGVINVLVDKYGCLPCSLLVL